ncbi:hypothetical protein LINPERHAP1_LOCUS23930, partial [Linum perenne]
MFVARGKIGYLTGATVKPEEGKSEFDVWDAENSMVMTWLVNSMMPEIGANFLGYATAKELWNDVSSTYSDLGNQSQMRSGGRIIGRDPLPPIAEVFNEVRREETRRKVMLGARKEIQTTEGAAFQATGGILGATPNALATQRHHGHDPKAHLRCDFCGKTRHTKNMCWKLHPHLKNGGRNGEAEKPRANAATSHGGVSMLTSKQIEQLLSL